MKVAMCFGTFDNLHPGHENYLQQAVAFNYQLIVVVARDKTVQEIKGRLPQENEKTRLSNVHRKIKELGIDGRAILGRLGDRWALIKKHRPQMICLGYDQQVDLGALKKLIISERFFCEVRRLRAHQPDKYKSSFCVKYESK